MNLKSLAIALSIVLAAASCSSPAKKEMKPEPTKKAEMTKKEAPMKFQNKAHELVYELTQEIGDLQRLKALKDVVYTYTYTTPDGLSDISTEKYIFEGELAYGEFKTHQRTLPDLEGTMEQGFDGKNYWLKANGKTVTDEDAMKMVKFGRPTNFYWFAMLQKLTDPGLNYEYIGEKKIGSNDYDIVKITFGAMNKKPADIYQIYINKKTKLVDQFLFTVAEFGRMDTPLLMELNYEKIDGILIPNKRKYKTSNWDAEVSEAPWTTVTWTNIKFNNGLTKAEFML